jgi:hypothetical protein
VPTQELVDRANQLRQDTLQYPIAPAGAAVPLGGVPIAPASPVIVPAPVPVPAPPIVAPPGTTSQRLPVVSPTSATVDELLPPP